MTHPQLSFDLHGVVDGETRNDGSTGTIDVQVDGLVAVLASCHSTAVDAVAASLPRNPSKASGCPKQGREAMVAQLSELCSA